MKDYFATLSTLIRSQNGYIDTKDFIKLGIPKASIGKWIKKLSLRKVSHGIYLSEDKPSDELFILQKRYPTAIFSFNTAFYLLNLSPRTPNKIDVSFPFGRKMLADVCLHYENLSHHGLGLITIESPLGNTINIYSKERSVVDMIKANDFDLELQNRILEEYFKSKDKDVDLLLSYAKEFKVYEKINTILEVMMKW